MLGGGGRRVGAAAAAAASPLCVGDGGSGHGTRGSKGVGGFGFGEPGAGFIGPRGDAARPIADQRPSTPRVMLTLDAQSDSPFGAFLVGRKINMSFQEKIAKRMLLYYSCEPVTMRVGPGPCH